jgi:hypothetical protein
MVVHQILQHFKKYSMISTYTLLLIRKIAPFLLFLLAFIAHTQVFSQQKYELNYFLPEIKYNPDIKTPEQFFGYQPGVWHPGYDLVHNYMQYLAQVSDRVEYEEYGRTHEYKANFVLKISSPENLRRQEEISRLHRELCLPDKSKNIRTSDLPLVLYQGFTVHGNEPSGTGAAIFAAYYLAAGQSDLVLQTLENCFILLDPIMNPDGYNRFTSWVNTHKSKNLISDPASREFNEIWPGARSNHYWFDLNRDWLHLSQPESEGRAGMFHRWRPNILTDHHEMGTNSTYFFQPGVPSRTNPNTPEMNQILTGEIAAFHAKALDSLGSLYYSKSQFDDYYYGKGSTFPDIHGCIGILFEQASSRGHLQQSIFGPLSFEFTIRNQLATTLSTQLAAISMKEKLMNYKRDFFVEKMNEANKSPIKSYIMHDIDEVKLYQFLSFLQNHQIELEQLESDLSIQNYTYPAKSSYLVRTEQAQAGLIKSIFEEIHEFRDSIFYDISSWTVPYAYGIQFHELDKVATGRVKSKKIASVSMPEHQNIALNSNSFSVIIERHQHYAAAIVLDLMQKGIKIMAAHSPIHLHKTAGQRKFERGSFIIPLQIQSVESSQLEKLLNASLEKYSGRAHVVETGYDTEGMSLGHPDIKLIKEPKATMLIGQGVSYLNAGEIWHFMDQHLGTSISMVDKKDFGRLNLSEYNTLLLASGSYGDLSDAHKKKIQDWVQEGHTIIAFSNTVSWLQSAGMVNLTTRKSKEKPDDLSGMASYEDYPQKRGSGVLGGAIFNADIDLTHPLAFGYPSNSIKVFKSGTKLYDVTKNKYATPVKINKEKPLASGYAPPGFTDEVKEAASVSIHGQGRGKIVCFHDNVVFRAQWLSGYKMFENAMLFAPQLNWGTVEN